jgi:hypothetical protein
MINPYEPPRAEVVSNEPALITRRPDPPRSVTRAVTCLIGCNVLSALLTMGPWMGLWRPVANSSNWPNILGVLFLVLITWKIGTGKRWAWWLNTVLYVGGVLAVVVSFILAPEVMLRVLHALPGYMIASGIIQYTVQGIAFAFLLSADSRRWFRGSRAYAKTMD